MSANKGRTSPATFPLSLPISLLPPSARQAMPINPACLTFQDECTNMAGIYVNATANTDCTWPFPFIVELEWPGAISVGGCIYIYPGHVGAFVLESKACRVDGHCLSR